MNILSILRVSFILVQLRYGEVLVGSGNLGPTQNYGGVYGVDVNRDGFVDAFMNRNSGGSPWFATYISNGANGSFLTRLESDTRARHGMNNLVGDFNGDNIGDVLVLSYAVASATPLLWLGQANATWNVLDTVGFPLMYWGTSAMADFNIDGYADVAACYNGLQ